MNQYVTLGTTRRQPAVESLTQFVVSSIEAAHVVEAPFYHLQFDKIFPDDIYNAMLMAMPVMSDYRPMSGRSKVNDLADGTHTRVKMDLFPEYIRHLPPSKRAVWWVVGRALCSQPVKEVLVRKLAPALARRLGSDYAKVAMYPIPILTRDISGYHISPHTDTRWKGITVQLYLPTDDSCPHVGTIFHERRPDGSLSKKTQMKFSPNTGYAFAVGNDTWHSVDTVGPEMKTRDSILHTYFVDAGPLCFLRNRVKRIGNFISNEIRNAKLLAGRLLVPALPWISDSDTTEYFRVIVLETMFC